VRLEGGCCSSAANLDAFRDKRLPLGKSGRHNDCGLKFGHVADHESVISEASEKDGKD